MAVLQRIQQAPERNTLIHDNFCVQERVQDGDLSIKKGLPSKLCADVETKPVSASVLQQHCNVSGLYSTDHGSHTPQDDGTSVGSIQRRMCETERHRQLSELVGAIIVRGGVLKCTLVVEYDRTVHGVHTDTVAFSLNTPDHVQYLCLSTLIGAHCLNCSRKRSSTSRHNRASW